MSAKEAIRHRRGRTVPESPAATDGHAAPTRSSPKYFESRIIGQRQYLIADIKAALM
jgi:hypothetical protein